MIEESNSDGDYWNEFELNDPLGDEFVDQIVQQSMLLEYFNSMQVIRASIPTYFTNSNREILKKYTTLSTQPKPKPSPFDKNKDPFFIVKVLRSQGQLIDSQYYITKDGLIDSKKNTITEDIVIGKLQHQGNSQTIPNDIILNNDRNIGKIHCKLITKPTFLAHSQIPSQFYLFLSSAIAQRLPIAILTKINYFIRSTPIIGVQDLGTGQGTQVKLSNKKGLQIQVNQSFLIGSETKFKILETGTCHTEDRKHFQSRYSNIQFIEKLKSQPSMAHYILLAVHRLEPTFYLFISNLENSIFKIGRSQDSEIKIDQNTISRKQCRVVYSQNKWVIFDGEIDKESSNGSWFEIKSDNDKDNESEIQQFIDDFEMKIGETVLRIEFHNFHKPKQQLVDINNLLN